MSAHTSIVRIRVDSETCVKASEVLAAIGLSVADAVRLLLHRVAADQAFPLTARVPNAKTRAAMAEADVIALLRRKHHVNAECLSANLENMGGAARSCCQHMRQRPGLSSRDRG